ncbi:hypothetical protein [Nocardioides sp.]|uniref:hypothetical protein n=1 Tax=Nocardioides sp. TaxID=35761 RepID=UPI00271ABFD6|nr:hypothetical protein [Nocardioides sp.]MDO9458379.1 hypothetical protein [Nocardioides sp.]
MSTRCLPVRNALGLSAALAVVAIGLVLPPPGTAAVPPAPRAAAADDSFAAARTVSRVFVDATGAETPVASYDVTVKADQTRNLRGRQRIRISWSGAQPSGGRAANPYGEKGLAQEYPVVVMQCRGRDDATLPAAQQLRPETCWTASVAQRSQVLRSEGESSWRRDLYADEARQSPVSGAESVEADQCPPLDVTSYSTALTPFVTRAGETFSACSATTMPPEAAVDAAFPPAEINAFTDENGNGSVNYELRSDVENESLGCSDKVACSIVVIPIVGLSCAQPSSPASVDDKACRAQGRFAPGSSNGVGAGIDLAVGPALWWSASNWRNRFSIPVTFGLPPDTCDVLDSRPPTGFYGSELIAQAGLQWSPAYCLNQKRFKLQLNQTSDIAGFNLMENGTGPAAVVSSEQESAPGGDPVGYAPTAITGFAVGYEVDRPDNAGEFTHLRLNARLIAKLLSQSYLGSDLGRGHPGIGDNPLAMMNDPEFQQLNRGLSQTTQEAAATVLSLSNDSDVIEQLTEYLAQDEDAAAFLGGKPDPWGMKVNPAYEDIELPRPEWPLLDTYIPETENTCRQQNPSVYFSQLAAPVTTLRKISEALLDAWPNVQTKCDYDPSTLLYKVGRVDRQSYGARFVLGIVSLGDAARYGLKTAALQTRKGTFVAPTDASMTRAIVLSQQRKPRLPFVLDQADVAKDGKAYPGTMVVYTAARLRGLDKETAATVAQFVRISTTEGQVRGSGNGELPAGYVPIRKTGPTATLFASAQLVAAAIEAQKPAPGTPAPTGGPTGTTDTGPGPTDGGDLTPPGDDAPSTAPAAPTTSSAPVLDVADPAPTSATTVEESGTAGKLLPLLLLAALVGGLVQVGSRFFVRPPRGLS